MMDTETLRVLHSMAFDLSVIVGILLAQFIFFVVTRGPR